MMNIYIPIADVTLTDGQTYDGQIPVWATRPVMLRLLPDLNKPVNIIVREGGTLIKRITLPYQEIINFDLSFAAPLLRRADRNNSEGGGTAFPQQMIEIWGANTMARILIPVFHCDETYWDTLGVDAALPQPPKPRIPNQTLDIYFPYRINPADPFQVEVEPVTGAPSNVIFPATYVLGNTIDITYIKKLTIKNVWGNGLDQVINYEDRLMSDAIYDTGLQCALRARWNMRNGQWFWGAFKDYFWSNKFTPIRGRGGVTEQAEITINLEYGEEWYNVYQELLVSSNVVFDLNIPGINQYQSKRFRAEVSGDTGARWSNSAKTYRQQVRFKTTELQDNYIFPLSPDQPPTPSIAFSAQRNPWSVGAAYAEGITNSIYSNAAWEVQSTPSWMSAGSMVTLTAADFEQGGIIYTAGVNWEDMKTSSPNSIRTKSPIFAGGVSTILKCAVAGYNIQAFRLDGDGVSQYATASANTGEGVTLIIGACQYFVIRVLKNPAAAITPADATAAQIGVSVNRFSGNAGTSNLTVTVAANTGEARTGNIVLKSKAGPTTYNITVMQAGISGNISVDTPALNVDYLTHPVTVNVTSFGNWSVSARDTWITPNRYAGANGTATVTLTIADNTSNDARTGIITFYNDLTGNIAVVTINQTGAPTSIGVYPFRMAKDKSGAGTVVPGVVSSENNWIMGSAPSWVSVTPTSGGGGQTDIFVKYDTPNNTGAKRGGYLRIENMTTHEIAICIIEQLG